MTEVVTHARYFPVRIGVVDTVEGDVVRMTNGDWRLVSEGLPFERLAQDGCPHRPSAHRIQRGALCVSF